MCFFSKLRLNYSTKISVFYKIFLYFLLPIVVISSVSLAIYTHYLNLFENETKQEYVNTLASIADYTDNYFYELFQSSVVLSNDKDISEVLENSNQFNMYKSFSSLARFTSTKRFIENAFIMDKSNNIILTSEGVSDIDSYLNKYYVYKNYSKDFFLSLPTDKTYFNILKPTIAGNNLNRGFKNVIPIVQSGFGRIASKSIFVVNINENSLLRILNQSKSTPNSMILIADDNGDIYVHADSNQFQLSSLSIDLMSNIINKGDISFIYYINGERMLVITHKPKYSLLNNFTYIAFIPLKDILKKVSYVKRLAYFLILGFILSIAILFFMSKKLYHPISNIISMLHQNNNDAISGVAFKDEFNYILNQIGDILSSKHKLEANLSFALPRACERYLLEILYQNEPYLGPETIEFLSQNDINFKYNNFASILIYLKFTDEFDRRYSVQEKLIIQSQLMYSIRNVFPENFCVYVLTMESYKLCTIINIPDNQIELNLEEYILNIGKIVPYDKNLLKISAGIGRIHKNFIGLHDSYKEAQHVAALFSNRDEEQIVLFGNENFGNKYNYSINDENKLINLLLKGKKNEVQAIIKSIVDDNIKSTVTELELKELYIHLYKTARRVLKEKGLTVRQLMGDKYINISQYYRSMQLDEISSYVESVFNDLLVLQGKTNNSKINIKEIMEQMEISYAQDIYLEQFSDFYKVTPQYLSKVFKETNGITFYEYLSSIRIDKARDLLLNTHESIDSIASKCGFNSRHTFIRMFKKLESITPTEYRELN